MFLFEFVQVNFFGLLGFVLVGAAFVNVEVAQNGTTQTVLRQHATNSSFNQTLWALSKHLLRSGEALATRETRVAHVRLLRPLVTTQLHLAGIDDDHVITAVSVRGEIGFVFATNHFGHFRSKATQLLSVGIYHDPLLICSSLVGRNCFVTDGIHDTLY